MTWLTLFFALEIGITPQISLVSYSPEVEWDMLRWGVFYTELDAEIQLFRYIFAGGMMRTYMVPAEGINFSPRYNIYDFRAGLRWQMLEVGWRHRCFHPMIAYQPLLNVEIQGIEGAYDEIYFRVEVER